MAEFFHKQTEYFLMEHGTKKKWWRKRYSDIPILPVKTRKYENEWNEDVTIAIVIAI